LEKFNWRLAYRLLYRYMLKCLHKGHVDNIKEKLLSKRISLGQFINLLLDLKRIQRYHVTRLYYPTFITQSESLVYNEPFRLDKKKILDKMN